MRTPLLGIRVQHSEVAGLRAGHQFDTLADFEAALEAARSTEASGRVAFVLIWKTRATFHGVYHLDRREGLVDHVARVCRDALREPRLSVLLPGIRWTLARLFEAAVAERVAARRSQHRQGEEGACRTAAA